MTHLTRHRIVKDLEKTFQTAFAQGSYAAALRAKELQAKILGYFVLHDMVLTIPFQEMSNEQVCALIQELEGLVAESNSKMRSGNVCLPLAHSVE